MKSTDFFIIRLKFTDQMLFSVLRNLTAQTLNVGKSHKTS